MSGNILGGRLEGWMRGEAREREGDVRRGSLRRHPCFRSLRYKTIIGGLRVI